jgi:pimeloyl-ACP methyl ester carboxylesterase
VRSAVTHLFTTFGATGSASAVVKAFARDQLTYPGRHLTGPRAGQVYWRPLRHDQVLSALHNPRYAGAYCYGRQRHVTDAEGHQRVFVKPTAEWTSLILGAHPGFITWEQFQANQAQLAANAPARGQDRRAGPPREGPALLQGLLVCGKCGTRMTVKYHARADGSLVPDYACQREGIATGTRPCQDMCGSGVDAAVAEFVLAAVTPMALQAALTVSAELADRAADADRLRASHVQRAQHAADTARRRYLAVDPTNRLVADALEADWNHRLRELTDAQDDYDSARDATTLTDTQAERIRALASDLPALWRDPATPMRERKRLIRLLVTDVTLLRTDEDIRVDIRLPGGQLHQLTVPRPRTAGEQHTTPATTIALIEELMDEHTVDEAVTILNSRGLTGGWGKPFSVSSLQALCRLRGIPSLRDRLRAAGMLTLAELADELGVTTATVKNWHRLGLITGRRVDYRVLSLVLVSTSPVTRDDRQLPAPTAEFGRFVTTVEVNWSDPKSVIEYLVGYWRVLAGGARPFDQALFRDLARRDVQRAQDFTAAHNHDVLDHGEPSREPLSSISSPTLVIHGTADPMFPIGHGEALAEEIPDARLLWLEGAGHGVYRADWQTSVAAILEHTRCS